MRPLKTWCDEIVYPRVVYVHVKDRELEVVTVLEGEAVLSEQQLKATTSILLGTNMAIQYLLKQLVLFDHILQGLSQDCCQHCCIQGLDFLILY